MSRESEHACHAQGCPKKVPPSIFMCKRHWFMLPKAMRDAIWDKYVPGQEDRMDPSPFYLDAAHEAVDYISKLEQN